MTRQERAQRVAEKLGLPYMETFDSAEDREKYKKLWNHLLGLAEDVERLRGELGAIRHVCNEISDGRGENNMAVIRAFRATAEGALRFKVKAKNEDDDYEHDDGLLNPK